MEIWSTKKISKEKQELIRQIYTHISLWKLNQYENTQSNLSGEWWIMKHYYVINNEKLKRKQIKNNQRIIIKTKMEKEKWI